MRSTALASLLCLGLLGLAGAGCSSVRVKTDFDPQANFGRYRTYRLEPGRIYSPEGREDSRNSLARDRIERALAGGLAGKGLTVSDQPDLVVTYVAGAHTRQELESIARGGAYGFYGFAGPGFWWGAPGYNDFWTRTYTEGTLVIDFVDASTGRLVWRAYAVAELNDGASERLINEAVQKSLEKYPPS